MPENVDFIQFYYKCKEKNLIVTSRFKGVNVGNSGNNNGKPTGIVWMAYIQINNKKHTKKFPFNREGEIAASKWYNEMKEKINI